MKYTVTIQYVRAQTLEIEASSAEEARELVASGEFDDNLVMDGGNVVDDECENVEILDVFTSAK